MPDDPLEAVIRETTFRNEAVDMWVPFQGPAKGMQDPDNTGDKVFRFVDVMEHTQDNTADSLEKAVKKGPVFEKEVP